MTSDLLDAECVINHLSKQNVISIIEWKNRHPNDQDYTVYFIRDGSTKSDIGINIIKRSEKYYVSLSLVKILAYRHQFETKDIYKECSLSA
jgi:hypothetical protein